jgi:hypothetical protein
MRAYSLLNRLLLLVGDLTGAISLQAQLQIVSKLFGLQPLGTAGRGTVMRIR